MTKDDSSSAITQTRFTWADIPRSIYYFLDQDRRRWVVLNSILLVILFYDIVPPLVFGRIVDFFTTYRQGQSLSPFLFLCVFLGATHAVIALVRLSSKNSLSRIAITARTRARIFGFERLVNLPLQWHAQENTGNKIERIFTGSQSILDWARLSTNSIFPITISFLGVLGVFLFLSPIFVVFIVVYLFLFFSIERHYNKRLSYLSHLISKHRQRASGAYVEGSGNILAIKALGAEKGMNRQVKQSEEEAQRMMLERNSASTRKWYLFQTLNGISFTAFSIMTGFQVVSGAISIGMILVFFSFFAKLREAANEATELTGRMIEMKADLGNMMPIFKETGRLHTGNEPFPKDAHGIVIQNGSFEYPSGQVGLSGLNFELRQGEIVGVAGPSGGGKSTLVKILLGLYALRNGTFTVGALDYDAMDHEEFISHVAVVLQETELFNMSLQENITLLRDVDEARLEQAVKIAQLDAVISKLPDGLQTLIGERGYKLSGGERQRLGIARAIYKDAPILILDEATSSLDSQTEKNILDVLLAELGDRKTILIIAHRISTLKGSDRVLFIEKGAVVEEGVYQDLIANPTSKLAHLYAMQSGGDVAR